MMRECCFSTMIFKSTNRVVLAGYSMYDTVIDVESIQERLGKLKTHQYVMEAERLFEEKDFVSVLARLAPAFLENKDPIQEVVSAEIEDKPAAVSLEVIGGSLSERLGLMTLLYKVSLVSSFRECGTLHEVLLKIN